jgi:hypothetical protein
MGGIPLTTPHIGVCTYSKLGWLIDWLIGWLVLNVQRAIFQTRTFKNLNATTKYAENAARKTLVVRCLHLFDTTDRLISFKHQRTKYQMFSIITFHAYITFNKFCLPKYLFFLQLLIWNVVKINCVIQWRKTLSTIPPYQQNDQLTNYLSASNN